MSFQTHGNIQFAIKIIKITAYVEYKRYTPLSRSSGTEREFENKLFLVHIICCVWHLTGS
jgi:hypothetical protein